MSKLPREYFRYILDESDYLVAQTRGLAFAAFSQDPTLKRTFVHSPEIIGEAVKHLPEEQRAQKPDIKWRKIGGMRDRLIYNYCGVDYLIVWDIVTTKLQPLQSQLQALIKSLRDR